MSTKYVIDEDAKNGGYMSTAYCYNDKCSAKTEKEPWPHSDGIGKRNKLVCKHCGMEMTWTFPASEFE